MKHFFRNHLVNIIRLFLLIYIPVAIFSTLSFRWQFDQELNKNKILLQADQKQYLTSLSNTVELQYRELLETLIILLNANETQQYLDDPTENSKAEMEALFLRIATAKPTFDQIRLLDHSGQEIARVNQNDGEPTIIASENLQDKSNRYYFQESIRLLPGEIYISDLDLNVENGQIEIPYRPMIRVGSPVFDSNGNQIGVLLINCDASDLLQNFESITLADSHARLQSFLINEHGDYLYHAQAEKTFAFMFHDRSASRLSIDNSSLWKSLHEKDTGSYETDQEIFQFVTLTPGKQSGFQLSQTHLWYLIVQTNLSELPLIANQIAPGLTRQNIFVLFALAGFCLLLAIVFYFLKRDQAQLQLTSMISENTHDAVLVTDHNTRIIRVNQAFEAITGFSQHEVQGLTPNVFKSGKQSRGFYENMWASLAETGHWEGELWDKKKDGTLYPKALKIHAIRQKYTKRVTMYIGIFSDLSSLKREQESAMRLRHYNPKTNLPNETLLARLLYDNLETCDGTIYLIYFSLQNYFSLYAGKASAHDIVQNFLRRIQELLGPHDIIAQTSEDQFVISTLLTDQNDSIEDFLDRFYEVCNQPIYQGKRVIQLEVKAGVSAYPKDAQTSEDLLKKGYLALHAAIKESGMNVMFYDKALQEDLDYKLAVASRLRSALAHQEFQLVYQPQIDLSRQHATGAEALLRWQNPELGSISPAVFIPLAEEKQIIVPLGYWIIDTAFKDLSQFQSMLPEDFRLSINLSPVQFADRNLIPYFIETAKKHQINLHHVEIEITETTLLKNLKAVRNTLEDFRLLGVSVAIDDFGTGFSSFSYLNKLPLNKIKVDREFIKDYPYGDQGKLAKVMTTLAETINATLLMEGAETQEQIDFLQKIGYDQVQGFFYSKPLDIDALIQYLNRKSIME